MARESYVRYEGMPSAIISDGLVTIPLYAVSQMGLTESYHLPPIGTSNARASVATHDDSISLSALLAGPERFAYKFTLETLAESGKRGTVLEGLTAGAASGLILITGMTVRTDMQIQSLSFTAQAGRRDVLDVSMTLLYMPRPGGLAKLLDVGNLGVRGLLDFGVL
jgi:phage protein U